MGRFPTVAARSLRFATKQSARSEVLVALRTRHASTESEATTEVPMLLTERRQASRSL